MGFFVSFVLRDKATHYFSVAVQLTISVIGYWLHARFTFDRLMVAPIPDLRG